MNTQNPAMETQLDRQSSAAFAGLKRASFFVGRVAMAVIIVAIAIAVGVALPIYFSDWISRYPPAGLALGAAAILGVFRGLVATLPTIWDFIWNCEPKTLPKIFAEIAVAALGLGFAYYAVPATPQVQAYPVNLQFAGPVPPVVVNESDSILSTYITFPEKSAVLVENDPQIGLVNNLVDTLATCIQTPNDEVVVAVRAYASSSGSDGDNEKLYKDRTAYAAKLLQDHMDASWPDRKSRFKIERREWASLKVMSIRRLFKDTDASGTYLEKAGALNRRADIKVRSLGSCLPG